jgi:probable F420-dependent oxidoreductase
VKPFRFGVSALAARDRRDWRKQARRAESMGFDVLLVPDHLVAVMPPLTALCTAAEATKHLRVGTFVVNNDFRHPVVVAREAAAVDLLTDGRLELGLGAGHMKAEYDEIGVAFDPPHVRVARLAESVEIISRLLAGEEVTFEGEHYSVRGHRAYPAPAQAHVPVLVGGNGRRVLSIAARHADIVGFTGFSQIEGTRDVSLSHFGAAGLAERVALVEKVAGERFDDLELNLLLQYVEITHDRRGALSGFLEQFDVPDETALDSPFLLVGTPQQMADALRERRERFGVSYFVAPARCMDALAPVIELVRDDGRE